MRTKQALKNTVVNLILEAVLAISGIIVPRFFTALYGSAMNGLVSSITQFITYMGLVEAGIGAAGTVALYRPLADGDLDEINGLVAAAKKFYYRSGLIFVALDVALIALYPLILKGSDIDPLTIRLMIIILSASGIVDYFVLGKYRVLLTADQRLYVISIAQIAGTLIMTVASIVLIELEVSALLVKSAMAVAYILRTLAIVVYARHHYPDLDLSVTPRMASFNQRWAALLHQIVGMICNNAAVILLTVMLTSDSLEEISVYSVYSLVLFGILSILNSISNALSASFGQIIAKGENDVLQSSFSSFEYLMYMISFIAVTCMMVILHPFISLYSADFTDGIEYVRWPLVILFSLVEMFVVLKLPGLTLIVAAGHYKQTRSRAIIEATINLTVSILLVRKLGIVGVLCGMCASYTYRSIDTIFYAGKHFVKGTTGRTFMRILRNAVTCAVLCFAGIKIVPMEMSGWLVWLLWTVGFAVVTLLCFMLVNIIFEPKQFKKCVIRFLDVFKSKS